MKRLGAFSPLFIGAMAATQLRVVFDVANDPLSVPFSSGQWLLPTIGLDEPCG